jgi:hypothetical protein
MTLLHRSWSNPHPIDSRDPDPFLISKAFLFEKHPEVVALPLFTYAYIQLQQGRIALVDLFDRTGIGITGFPEFPPDRKPVQTRIARFHSSADHGAGECAHLRRLHACASDTCGHHPIFLHQGHTDHHDILFISVPGMDDTLPRSEITVP